ncbi:restriction endonuclease subunit S [uncultured Aquimarina sp.]|uniref:restriction endonuclease subunit S n=1 Tax=uncultured Aquimarina sp. TaxID=575652 RepID=UPI00262E1D35|nr:restriction endonuclease subunit S [uncultured Aquimarina sp.]
MSYKRLGDYIQPVNIRNKELWVTTLLGVSVKKIFIPSIANTIGTDFKKYKIVKKHQFVYIPDTSRRGDKIGIAMLEEYEKALVSQAYSVFEIKDQNKLLSEYLMMWFRRPEFDRYARYKSHGSVREIFDWDEVCDIELPIPSIEKQQQIVAEYNTVTNRIKLNENLNQKLEETAQALYKHWFVDFEFPNAEGKPYKSSGGEMVFDEELEKNIPVGWRFGVFKDIANITMGQSPKGDTYNFINEGVALVNGPVEFGKYFTKEIKWTSSPTKKCEEKDLIVCVRGSTVGRFVKSDGIYCIGRGVCSIKGKYSQCFVDEFYKSSLNELRNSTTGSTFPSWDRNYISSFNTIVPTIDVQTLFEKKCNQISSLILIKSAENENLKEITTMILAKMVKIETIPKTQAV